MARRMRSRRIASGVNGTDDLLGNLLDAAFAAKHRRRLARHGWAHALAPVDGDAPGWVGGIPVRGGNSVEVLIDGEETMSRIRAAVENARRQVHITGWHACPDFELERGGTRLLDLLAAAADRVPVRLLLWPGPPVPVLNPTRAHVRRDWEQFTRETRIECELDDNERLAHCHHEKIVLVDDEVAIVGGLDLTDVDGDRLDLAGHPDAGRLGWHDVACEVRGPIVADLAAHFAGRWAATTGRRLPVPGPQAPAGSVRLQMLRTVPERVYEFLPDGDFSVLTAYLQALRNAREFVYLENQFLWSPEVVSVLVELLRDPPREDFRLLTLLPLRPSNGQETTRGQLARLVAADDGAGRFLAATLLGPTAGSPGVYLHAKVGIVDDRWLTIGSANLNEHSLYNDSEVNLLTLDADLARQTRLRLWSEHLRVPVDELDRPVAEIVDGHWTRQCDEQDPISKAGGDPVHRVRRVFGVTHRLARVRGPLQGLAVDA